MKKFGNILLLLAFLAGVIAVIPHNNAAAVEQQYILGVNAINTGMAEGHSLIFTKKQGKVISSSPTAYSWWRTVTFEYSDEAEAYVITSISLTTGSNPGKNNYIPEDGFVLCVNVGNNYSASGGINYVNKISTDTYNNTANLEVGMKAWITGIDLEASTIDVSPGKTHYSPDFTTNAKIYAGGNKPENIEIYEPDRTGEQLKSVLPDIENNSLVTAQKDLLIQWEPVAGADGYIININNANLVSDGPIVVNNAKIFETQYTISGNLLEIGNSYMVSISAYGEGFRNSVFCKTLISAGSERAFTGKFKDKTIMAFGDSITAWPGWVDMLYGELGVHVQNAGVGGDTTENAIKRYQADVIAKSPDILFMLFGMNDQAQLIAQGKSNVPIEKYEANYRTIIEACHQAGIDIILMTGNFVCTDSGYYTAGGYGLDYGTEIINNYYDVIRKLAAEYEISLIDINEKCKTELNSKVCAVNDGVHLSAYGQELFTKTIADYMYDEYAEKEFASNGSEEESVASKEESNMSSIEEESVKDTSSDEKSSDKNNKGRNIFLIIFAMGISMYFVFYKKKKQ